MSKPSGALIHVSSQNNQSPAQTAVIDARGLIAASSTAALATLDRQSAGPYVSLVSIAATAGHVPVLLLSELAQHTQNLIANARASLLFSAVPGVQDPLTLARVTLIGSLERTADADARNAFLAQHPAAAQYADFGDFAFYRFNIENAHFIGGFGRIVALSRNDLLKG